MESLLLNKSNQEIQLQAAQYLGHVNPKLTPKSLVSILEPLQPQKHPTPNISGAQREGQLRPAHTSTPL